MIYHLEVGTTQREPTVDDLAEAIKEFSNPMPAFTIPVKINEIFYEEFPIDMSKQRLILNMGCKGWDPSVPERDGIRELFEAAILVKDANPVVATRFGVKVSVLAEYIYKDANPFGEK